jgi:hypothetical protein
MADAVARTRTQSLHFIASPPPLPPLQPSELPIASISKSQPPPPLLTESTVGDLARAPSLPQSTPAHHPAHPYVPDEREVVKRSIASPLPQPQQPAHRTPPTPTPPPITETAGTDSGRPAAFSSSLAKALFSVSDGEDISDPPDDSESSDGNPDTAVQRHQTAKRLRATSSPVAKSLKRRRTTTSVVKETAATGSHPPRPAQSSNRSKKMELDSLADDMDARADDGPESEDEVMAGSDDELGGGEKAASPPRRGSVRKGKATVGNVPSSSTPSSILSLGKDIPITYAPLGDPLEEDELFELDWFAPARLNAPQGKGKPSKRGKTSSIAPVSGVSPPVLQTGPMRPTRRWRSFVAPRMTVTPELEALGEVELSDGAFRFPFNAQVIKCFSSFDAFLIGQIIGRAGCKPPSSR